MKDILHLNMYLITNLLTVYTVYKFFKIFFDEERYQKYKIAVYLLYYITTTSVYLFCHNSLLTLVANIICMFVITNLYKSSLSKKCIAVALVYGVSMLVECIVVLIGIFFKWGNVEITGLIVSRIILLITVQILHTNTFIQKEILIPKIQWISIIVFPCGTVLLFLLLDKGDFSNNLLLPSVMILLFFNILIFYIFDKLNSEYIKSIDEKIKANKKELEARYYLQERNVFYNQLLIAQDTGEKVKMIQHDIKGHVFALRKILGNNDIQEALIYLERIDGSSKNKDDFVNTGNTVISSILNYFIKNSLSKGVSIDYSIKIPEEISIEPFDISRILINVLQNAIEAIEKCSNDKYLDIKMKYDKNILYIMVKNTYNSTITKIDGNLLTTKKDKRNHGIGIQSIKNSVDKYDGTMEYIYDDRYFKTYIMLYLK